LGAPGPLGAAEIVPWVDELRLGGAVSLDASGQSSGYARLEALLSPFPPVATYDPNFAWLFSPRPLIGAAISLQGKTNHFYAGLAWSVPLVGPLFAELTFGGLVHDQNVLEIYPDRPRLMTRFLFRESIAIGYEINPQWRVMVFADHGSNGNLGYGNRSINQVGVMLGGRLGPAADNRAPLRAPDVSLFSWAGPYAGINGGIAFGPIDSVVYETGVLAETDSQRRFSLNAGGHLGWSWVIGSLLWGVEADLSAQRLVNSVTHFGPTYEQFSVLSHWLASARARMGVDLHGVPVAQRLLLYVTGGAAVRQAHKSWCNPATDACFAGPGDVAGGWVTEGGTKSGWIAGAGIEVPLAPHASARAEYLFADFGTFSFVNGPIRHDITSHQHILRAGLSFGYLPL
jgi:opacity protein-like surface antigen